MMDNEKNVEVSTKTSIAVQLATGIAILALVTAGSGLIAYLATPRLGNQINYLTGGSPTAFSLLSPANGAGGQDYEGTTLTWEQSTEKASIDAQTQASPNWSFIKTANATHASMKYEVQLGLAADDGTITYTKVATITSRSYTATNLLPATEYTWKIVADTGHAKRTSNEIWTFTTDAATSFIQNLPELCTPGVDCDYDDEDNPFPGAAACGGNNFCGDGPEGDNILTCDEWNAVWLACNGIGNICPDKVTEKCLQMTICQCGSLNNDGVNVSPGGEQCETLMNAFVDPCI